MKKQQGGILEITGTSDSWYQYWRTEKTEESMMWKRHKDREGEKKKQILPNNCKLMYSGKFF